MCYLRFYSNCETWICMSFCSKVNTGHPVTDHPVTDTFVAWYAVVMELKSRIIIMELVLFVLYLPMCLARFQSTGRFFFFSLKHKLNILIRPTLQPLRMFYLFFCFIYCRISRIFNCFSLLFCWKRCWIKLCLVFTVTIIYCRQWISFSIFGKHLSDNSRKLRRRHIQCNRSWAKLLYVVWIDTYC